MSPTIFVGAGTCEQNAMQRASGRRRIRQIPHCLRRDGATPATSRRKQYGYILDCINRRNTESGIDLCLKGEV